MPARLEFAYFIVMFVFVMVALIVLVRWEYIRSRRGSRRTDQSQRQLDPRHTASAAQDQESAQF